MAPELLGTPIFPGTNPAPTDIGWSAVSQSRSSITHI
jgi:hypothetical protein